MANFDTSRTTLPAARGTGGRSEEVGAFGGGSIEWDTYTNRGNTLYANASFEWGKFFNPEFTQQLSERRVRGYGGLLIGAQVTAVVSLAGAEYASLEVSARGSKGEIYHGDIDQGTETNYMVASFGGPTFLASFLYVRLVAHGASSLPHITTEGARLVVTANDLNITNLPLNPG